MLPSDVDYTTRFSNGQLATSITQTAIVPALIEKECSDTKRRFVEFFTANTSNPNTRAAYLRAVTRFCLWCEGRKLTLVASYIEGLEQKRSRRTVKQHLAAVYTRVERLRAPSGASSPCLFDRSRCVCRR